MTANADTVSYTSNVVPLTATNLFPQSLTLQEFNSSLGTLTGINLSFTGNFQGTSNVFNASGQTATITSLQSSVPLTLNGPASIALSTTVTSIVSSLNFPLTVLNGNQASFNGPISNSTGFASPIDFADYTGSSSSTLSLSVSAGNVSATGSGSTTGNSNALFYSGSGSAGGYASVTYTYTPAVSGTPEPGTWAMLVAGASTGLVALRRRRNKK
jgi:hypothetical protein